MVRYIFEIGGERPVQKLRALAAKQMGKDAEEAVVSYADQLRAEGRKEGRKEGRREGTRKGRRDMLLLLLRTRFGDLPEPIAARVDEASAVELERWGQRILGAQALRDVFDDG